ncbi:HK97 family phage prohead protease [Luteimonas sp. A501]
MERRHETFLRVKQAESSDGERWITAWATTRDEDLVGDIVSPTGAQYELPIPLLAFHKADSPVGVVTEAHVSASGIRVRAKLTRGVALADEMWELLKDGAIGAVSIGFKALKSKPLKSGGLLFEAWRWLELSLTPIPCNTNARIIHVGKGIAYADEQRPAGIRVMPPTETVAKRATPQMAEAKAAELGDDYWKQMERGGEAALALLPPDVAKLANPADIGRGHDRNYRIRDHVGRELAVVKGCGKVILAGQPHKQKAAPEGLTRTQAAQVRKMLEEVVSHEGLVQFAGGIGECIRDAVQPVKERLEQLESSALHDGGFFTQDKSYERGALVTHDGSTYLAMSETSSHPGTCHSWRLIGRKGR